MNVAVQLGCEIAVKVIPHYVYLIDHIGQTAILCLLLLLWFLSNSISLQVTLVVMEIRHRNV